MLTPIKDTDILKRFSKPPGDPPEENRKGQAGSISVFPSSPLDRPAETFSNELHRRETNRKALMKWIKENLKPEIHYGRIHIDDRCQFARADAIHLCHDINHFSRPVLYKPGAERIIGVLGLTATFPNLKQYEMACVHRQEIQTVILRCLLTSQNGNIVAEGAGARHIRQDNWNLNTCIKMALKSALIDAVVRITGLSSVFIKTHQNTLTRLGHGKNDNLPGVGDCNDRLPPMSECNSTTEKPATRKQIQLVQYLAGRKGYTTNSLDKHCQGLFGKSVKDLDKVQAHKLINQFING